MPTRDEAARSLVLHHFEVEPELKAVYVLANDQETGLEEPIRLLEVNDGTLATGTVEVFSFGPSRNNSWLAVLRVVMKAAVREFDLPKLCTEGVTNFDASSHVTYSEGEPNSLTPEQVTRFLAELKETLPQRYAMTFLGLATGLRPSSLRPLRRKGAEADVLLE